MNDSEIYPMHSFFHDFMERVAFLYTLPTLV